jgi:hypothetical protein
LVVDPGSVHVPATHWDAAGGAVAQFEAQVVVAVPGSQAPATVDLLDELAVPVPEPPALPLAAPEVPDVVPALEPPLRLPGAPLEAPDELAVLWGSLVPLAPHAATHSNPANDERSMRRRICPLRKKRLRSMRDFDGAK